MSDFLTRNGSLVFLGLPFLCYLAQAGLFGATRRYGMSMMLVGYAFALIGQYLDTKGI